MRWLVSGASVTAMRRPGRSQGVIEAGTAWEPFVGGALMLRRALDLGQSGGAAQSGSRAGLHCTCLPSLNSACSKGCDGRAEGGAPTRNPGFDA